MSDFKKGDRVRWNYAGNTVEGVVKRKLTEPIDLNGHHVAASKDNPEYLVESSSTGKEAAHKPDALEKIED